MRDDCVIHMLPKHWCAAYAVQAHAIGDLDEIELFFFRQEGVDVGSEEGVGFEDFGADGALGAAFDFGRGAFGEVFFEHCWCCGGGWGV